jgi:hypothetical protein
MSLSSIAVTPGGKSLAAFHEERASLYGTIATLLEGSVDALERRQMLSRLARVKGAQPGARALVERALRDVELHEQTSAWSSVAPPGSAADLDALSMFAGRASQCARALSDGDVASAADLWDAQRADLDGGAGAALQAFASELAASELRVISALGRALGILLEDDMVLTRLGS